MNRHCTAENLLLHSLLVFFLLNLFFVQVASVMTVWTQMAPAYAGNMWSEALNKRLGTQVNNTGL